MKRLHPGVAMILGAVLSALLLLGVDACTPAQRDAAAVVVPALQRAACVVLHAAISDGSIDSICATAEELAPLVRTLLEARELDGPPPPSEPLAGVATVDAPARLRLAGSLQPIAELPTPKRRIARRHCALWVPVASSSDGGRGKDAFARDGADGSGEGAAPR